MSAVVAEQVAEQAQVPRPFYVGLLAVGTAAIGVIGFILEAVAQNWVSALVGLVLCGALSWGMWNGASFVRDFLLFASVVGSLLIGVGLYEWVTGSTNFSSAGSPFFSGLFGVANGSLCVVLFSLLRADDVKAFFVDS